jgi:hypothetical protein
LSKLKQLGRFNLSESIFQELRIVAGQKNLTINTLIFYPKGIKKSFYQPVAQQIIEYCYNEQIAFHTEILNLRSSQVCCFNVMFPLKKDLKLAAEVLQVMLPGVKEVKDIEFVAVINLKGIRTGNFVLSRRRRNIRQITMDVICIIKKAGNTG